MIVKEKDQSIVYFSPVRAWQPLGQLMRSRNSRVVVVVVVLGVVMLGVEKKNIKSVPRTAQDSINH